MIFPFSVKTMSLTFSGLPQVMALARVHRASAWMSRSKDWASVSTLPNALHLMKRPMFSWFEAVKLLKAQRASLTLRFSYLYKIFIRLSKASSCFRTSAIKSSTRNSPPMYFTACIEIEMSSWEIISMMKLRSFGCLWSQWHDNFRSKFWFAYLLSLAMDWSPSWMQISGKSEPNLDMSSTKIELSTSNWFSFKKYRSSIKFLMVNKTFSENSGGNLALFAVR